MPIMSMLLRGENNFSEGHLVQQWTIEHVGTFKKEMPGKIIQDYSSIIWKIHKPIITLLNCFFIPPMEGMCRLLRAPPNNDILILWNKDLYFSSLHILEPMLILNRCYQQGLSATTNLCPIHKKLSCFQQKSFSKAIEEVAEFSLSKANIYPLSLSGAKLGRFWVVYS